MFQRKGVIKIMGKRFHIETGQHTNGEMQLIYDNEGLDDYYFINDEKDFKDLCNELHEENEANKKTIRDLTNQLKFNKKMHEAYKKDAETLTEEVNKYKRFLQKSEMGNSKIQNSRYKCMFCGAVGFLHETFNEYED